MEIINTDAVPNTSGAYSHAVRVDNIVYISGQLPIVHVPDAKEGERNFKVLSSDDFAGQVTQSFKNLEAVAKAAGGTLKDIVKLNVYFCEHHILEMPLFNKIMEEFMTAPYPARTTTEVTHLPQGAHIALDAILHIPK